VHFLTGSKLVTGGNDAKVILWDLSKADQHHEHDMVANGDSTPEDRRNEGISELCRERVIAHSHKVNWLAPLKKEERWFVVVADQTSHLTVYPLS
jgi:hypothetical protein